ncbi:MAG: hypothetical protein FWF47_00090 [Clostridia bacterium]|nr:hypothetical protein [Clostridia bacterium]
MKKTVVVLFFICVVCMAVTGCSQKDNGTDDFADLGIIDLDISKMSGIMVYSQVVHIGENPAEYVGKCIKITGQYYASYNEETASYYHYVIVGDEALCCQAGLKFIWKGDHKYPNDYPALNTNIELIGIYEKREEPGKTNYYLIADSLSPAE